MISNNIWESLFIENQDMWGDEAADSALSTRDFFVQEGVGNVLVPGMGYGRNAILFHEVGMKVAGIEISQTALQIARMKYGHKIKAYEGDVSDMPYNDEVYDGIYCYSLIHLLDTKRREKLIKDCYNQLKEGGLMVFAMISKASPLLKTGKHIGEDRYRIMDKIDMYFYDEDAIQTEFGLYGIIGIEEIEEPIKNIEDSDPHQFFVVTCRKEL